MRSPTTFSFARSNWTALSEILDWTDHCPSLSVFSRCAIWRCCGLIRCGSRWWGSRRSFPRCFSSSWGSFSPSGRSFSSSCGESSLTHRFGTASLSNPEDEVGGVSRTSCAPTPSASTGDRPLHGPHRWPQRNRAAAELHSLYPLRVVSQGRSAVSQGSRFKSRFTLPFVSFIITWFLVVLIIALVVTTWGFSS